MRAVRYTNSKGNSITLGTSPIPTTLQDGIVGCWPMDNVSEYPDNASGTTYIQGTSTSDTWAGWAYSGSGGSIAVASGDLTLTCGTAGDGFVRTMSVLANKQWRLKVKSNAAYGSRTISIYNGTSETTYAITTSTNYQLVDVISALAFSAVTIRVNNCAATEVYTFDWIYVGDGSYSTKLPDISSVTNNLTLASVVPTAGLFDGAMIFNGSTSYLKTVNTFDVSPDVWHFQWKLPYGHARGATSQVFFNYRQVGDGHLVIFRPGSSDSLGVQYHNGSTSVLSSFSAFFTGFVSTRVDVSIDINWSSSAKQLVDGTNLPAFGIRTYRNGALVTTQLMSNSVKPAAGEYLYLGAYQGSSLFMAGTMESPCCYNRALTSAENNAIYRQNATPFVATGETSYGVVESMSGIDQAETSVSSTRAPVQDGATYIDTLLNVRELTVDGSLTVPKNIDTIYAQRKTIQDVLNPKYGLGTIDFFYGRNTINHRVLKNVAVDKLSFPNKPYQNPYQKFNVSFDGNDPYWYDPLTGTGSICILSGTSRTFTVGGENDTPPQITIYGAAANPSITNSTTNETLAMTYSLAGGSYINIDTNFGAKTIKLNGVTSLIGNLNIGSTFPRLQVGSNTVSYTGGGYIIIMWRNRYVGV